MRLPESLKNLKRLAEGRSSSFRPTVETFPDLDVDRVAREIDLAERGRQRGTREEPHTDDKVFDAVEAEIFETVGAAQKNSHDQLENHLTGYRQRLLDLDFESRFAAIHGASKSGLGDLSAEMKIGLDKLHGKRRHLRDVEQWWDKFRAANKLARPARKTTKVGKVFKVLVLVALVMVELAVNGELLSKSNELGLVGGILEALIFAILNVGVAFLFALFAIPNLNHVKVWRKAVGIVSLVAYLAAMLAVNIGLAHYREVSGALLDGADRIILERILANPLGLTEFRSWLLFALGALFSIVALIDGLVFRDAYPGYARVDGEKDAALADYAGERETLIRELIDIRSEYEDNLGETRTDLGKRRTEHDSIVAHRKRRVDLFDKYQDQLEKSGNQLLRIYRDANRGARKTAPPPHFGENWALKRISVEIGREGEWNHTELQASIIEAQANLDRIHDELARRFDELLKAYPELDLVIPEA